MNTPLKLAKTMNKCARVLHQGSSQLLAPRSGTWSTIGKPKSSISFKPSTSSHLSASSSAVLAAKESSVSVDQRRFYNERNDWCERKERNHQTAGMDATYEMPNVNDGQSRYDQIYMGKESAPIFEGNVEHEGFDPRYNDYHFKRQAHEPEQYREVRERRSSNARKAYDYVFGNKFPYNELTQQDTEPRRRMSQDRLAHQMRQERIIKENKLKWQNRAEPKREVYAHGTTYKTDKVYGAEKSTPRPSRAIKDRQSAEEYSRRRRAVRENELRRLADELRQSRKAYSLPIRKTERPMMAQVAKTEPPTGSYSSNQNEDENEMYWHSWNTCPDERRVIEKAQQVALDRGLGYAVQRPKPYHPYDVTRRSLHQHKYAKREIEAPKEYQYNLKAQTIVRPKSSTQLKREYLLNLMQQEEEIRNVQDKSDDDYDEEMELIPPTRRRNKLKAAHSQPEMKEKSIVEEPEPEKELIMRRPAERRISNYRIPIKRQADLPPVFKGEMKIKPQPRSIEPPRFQMSIKSKVVRNRAPVSSFSETMIGKMSTQDTKPKYRSFARPTVSSTAWGDSTSAHFTKTAHF